MVPDLLDLLDIPMSEHAYTPALPGFPCGHPSNAVWVIGEGYSGSGLCYGCGHMVFHFASRDMAVPREIVPYWETEEEARSRRARYYLYEREKDRQERAAARAEQEASLKEARYGAGALPAVYSSTP